MNSTYPEFITIGQVVAPWGNNGTLRVKVLTDFPYRFAPSATVYVNQQPVKIESVRWHKRNIILTINSINSRMAAEKLRGTMMEIHRSQLQSLPDGEYYQFQLIGLEVRTTQDVLLGNITEIIRAESNDIYVVSGSEGEILIPAIEDVVKSIDLEKKQIIIEPIEGILPYH